MVYKHSYIRIINFITTILTIQIFFLAHSLRNLTGIRLESQWKQCFCEFLLQSFWQVFRLLLYKFSCNALRYFCSNFSGTFFGKFIGNCFAHLSKFPKLLRINFHLWNFTKIPTFLQECPRKIGKWFETSLITPVGIVLGKNFESFLGNSLKRKFLFWKLLWLFLCHFLWRSLLHFIFRKLHWKFLWKISSATLLTTFFYQFHWVFLVQFLWGIFQQFVSNVLQQCFCDFFFNAYNSYLDNSFVSFSVILQGIPDVVLCPPLLYFCAHLSKFPKRLRQFLRMLFPQFLWKCLRQILS